VLDRDLARALPTPGCERAVVELGARGVVAWRLAEAYAGWRARSLERFLAGLRLDVALFPQQSIFPLRAPVPAVLTVVDVQYLLHPEHFGLFDRTFRAAVYPESLRRAERVIAISEHVRRTVVERCGVGGEKVVAIPLGWDPRGAAGVRPWAGAGGPYLYFPAFSHPHKNHLTLLRSYAALRARGAVSQRLVFTGGRTAHWKRIERAISELGLRGQVLHLGHLPHQEVRGVYAGADAVLFPTRYEGFGLPVLEAVELGKKVIASRLEVFDEIGLPRRFQIDFSDPDQLAAALALPGPTALERRPSTWREMAEATARALREVAAARGSAPGKPPPEA
jgi:glycosyltransferase involved in cell wall biosynthesis